MKKKKTEETKVLGAAFPLGECAKITAEATANSQTVSEYLRAIITQRDEYKNIKNDLVAEVEKMKTGILKNVTAIVRDELEALKPAAVKTENALAEIGGKITEQSTKTDNIATLENQENLAADFKKLRDAFVRSTEKIDDMAGRVAFSCIVLEIMTEDMQEKWGARIKAKVNEYQRGGKGGAATP